MLFKKKNMTAFLLAVVLCMISAMVPMTSSYAALPDDTVSPQYIAFTKISCDLTNNGGLRCQGDTKVSSAYKAGVQVNLEQYNGGWSTVKTWTASGANSATVDKTHYPASGYTYRLHVYHYAYNSSGTLVEFDDTYSVQIYY